MKTFTRLLQAAAVAATLGWGQRALADHRRSGPGGGFGGAQEHSHRHAGSERRVEQSAHGSKRALLPFPLLLLPRLIEFPAPLPLQLPAPRCARIEPARVIFTVNDCRRIAQPMIHGHEAVVEVRVAIGQPWVVIGRHAPIW